MLKKFKHLIALFFAFIIFCNTALPVRAMEAVEKPNNALQVICNNPVCEKLDESCTMELPTVSTIIQNEKTREIA